MGKPGSPIQISEKLRFDFGEDWGCVGAQKLAAQGGFVEVVGSYAASGAGEEEGAAQW
jgi:hypothetical protein